MIFSSEFKMMRLMLLLCSVFVLLPSFTAASATNTIEHSFFVRNATINRLCNDTSIVTVNGTFPGPTIEVEEGDHVVIHVHNQSPHNITIHWHGIFQLLTAWADGPNMVTQCPIQPGNNYTYRFRVTEQEGTLWWHAHATVLRATVYGAFIIKPKHGCSYPFPKPHKEVPIMIGEWWDGDVIQLEEEEQAQGAGGPVANAYTLNGLPGDVYSCSQNQTFRLEVERGKTYLLRIINAALNVQHFFSIANHTMTVVAVDAGYTTPYVTDVIVVAPGQTADVLITANQTVGSYYMAASPYATVQNVLANITRGILVYENATSSNPVIPDLPVINDTATAHKFFTNLTSLTNGPHWLRVPRKVDERMFVTFGLAFAPCPECDSQQRLSASMNNVSYLSPTSMSVLEAFFFNRSGVFTPDFPDNPPLVFDYTSPNVSFNTSLLFAPKETRIKVVKYNAVVEMVLQNTALITPENHPMHLHGFDFYVLAQGFGNYDDAKDRRSFNLVNPQRRNTIGVPVGGWAVIRFLANNPGVWYMHCHLDAHLPWGLAMVFAVENGPTPETRLPPPPSDFPRC